MSEIVKKENTVAKLEGFTTANEMIEFAKVLIDSKLVPAYLSTPEAVVSVVLQGESLPLSV